MSETKHGLSFSSDKLENALMENIDMMGSDDQSIAATARLNRGLVNAVDKWLTDQSSRSATSVDTMMAAMHGVTTVCGTLLVNVPTSKRPIMLTAMREQLTTIFDAMGKVILEEKP